MKTTLSGTLFLGLGNGGPVRYGNVKSDTMSILGYVGALGFEGAQEPRARYASNMTNTEGTHLGLTRGSNLGHNELHLNAFWMSNMLEFGAREHAGRLVATEVSLFV